MLSSIAIKRPVAAIMLTLMVVVVGIYSFISIPKALMPDIQMPYALVMTTYGGASPSEVETMVTEPLEQSLASVENLEALVSYSMENMSIVMLQFNVDTDMDFAALNMREAVDLVAGFLPEDVSDPMVMKLDMNMLPAMQIYVSGDMELPKLNTMVENEVLSYIERSKGVASVSVQGGIEEEISIKFNQQSLATYGVDLATVSGLLAAENINLPSGEVSKGDNKLIVRTMGEFDSIEDIKNVALMLSDYSIVRLGDIATITRDFSEQENITRIDGNPSIGIMVSKQSDANTVEVCEEVQDTLDKLRKEYPELTFTVGYDSSEYVNQSLASVGKSALSGALLAVLFVFLFLGNIRSTLVIAVSIPTSLLATFACMYFRGMTLNLVTLCSLTLVVGMLVDNSIVVLENIFRRRESESDAKKAATEGAKEIFMAIIASTLTTVLVFLPIALSDGMASLMFSDFCFTIIIALLASLVVALTVVPMFSSKLLNSKISNKYLRIGERRYKYRFIPSFMGFIDKTRETYKVYVAKALKNRKKFIIGCVIAFVASCGLVVLVGWELMPEMDEGSISISVATPYGTSLDDKDAILTQIEEYCMGVKEVDHLSLTTGALSSIAGDNSATITVLLKEMSERDRTTKEIAKEIEKAVYDIPGADIKVNGSSSIESLFASYDLTYNIMGKDNDTLESIGNELVEQISALDCVELAETDVVEGNPEVRVKIDRTAASYYGVTAYQLATGLSTALSGTSSTDVEINEDELSVKLSLDDSYGDSVENMKQIMIKGNYGTSVPVDQIATFEFDNSPSTIRHNNQSNYICVNVNVSGSLNKSGDKVDKIIEDYVLPEGYYYNTEGLEEQMYDMFEDLLLALIVAILLVFLLLAAQFESITMPFIVVMAIPFAMSGAFLALFVTNTALSMTSFLGLIILVGTVVNNSILLVEFINQNKPYMGRDEALVQAGSMRLRPILMSCGTTVIGMIPLSLGLGEGGELLAPMGISIIGGLIASTVVTLFLIPVIYAIIDDRQTARAERRAAKARRIAQLELAWEEEDARNEEIAENSAQK